MSTTSTRPHPQHRADRTSPVPRRPGARPGSGPAARAVSALAVRQVRRGTFVVALLSGSVTAVVAAQYRTTFSGPVSVASFEALAANPAIRTLFGTPRALDQAGGFTVWRTGTFLAVLVSVWGFLAATRGTRGEEDAGRWSLLLAGGVPVRQCVHRYLLVLWCAQVLVAACVWGGFVVGGAAGTGAVLHATGVALVGATYCALGVLSAQVLPDRRSAASACAAVLLLGLLLRMVADGVAALSWLGWLSPFGLLAVSRPFAGDRVLPLLLLALACGAVAAVAGRVATYRDVGDGLVRFAQEHRPRTRLLVTLPAFLVRRTLRPLLAWGLALAGYFLLIGLLARSMTEFLTANPRFAALAAQAGFAGLGSVEGYAASLFSLLAVPVGLFAASRVGTDAGDEDAGRLTLALAAPVTRIRWVVWHAAVVVVACLLLCAVAGCAVCLGATLVGAPLRLADSVAGAVNALPVAMLSLGAAALALAWAPRAVLGVGAVPVAGGFLLVTLAQSLRWPDAVRSLSPFTHLAAVPAAAADLPAAAVMLALAAGAVVAGALGFAHRDVRG